MLFLITRIGNVSYSSRKTQARSRTITAWHLWISSCSFDTEKVSTGKRLLNRPIYLIFFSFFLVPKMSSRPKAISRVEAELSDNDRRFGRTGSDQHYTYYVKRTFHNVFRRVKDIASNFLNRCYPHIQCMNNNNLDNILHFFLPQH